MSTDPTDPLEAARRANRVLQERVSELELKLQRLGNTQDPQGQTDATLRQREALLEEVERIAHVGSWVWDVVTNEVVWSDQLYRVLGYQPGIDACSTEAFFDRVHPEDRQRVRETSSRGIASGVSEQVDFRVQRPDGSIRHVTMDGALLFNAEGQLQRAVGTVLDVTEARESALKLAVVARGLEEAQRIGRMGSFEYDVQTSTPTWSEQMYRVTDIDPSTTNLTEAFIERLHPEDRDRIVKLMERSTTLGEVEPSRARFVHRDGSVHHVDMLAVSVRDEQGRLLSIRGTVTEVTELVKLEAQFHQSQKMEAIGQLAGGLAHDFNNLLTVIRGNAELLKERVSCEELDEIVNAAQLATSLTHRLLAFSRRSPQQTRVVQLHEDVRQAEGLLRRALNQHIVFRVEHAADLPFVRVDSAQVQQMLLNLIINARDAMPSGGTLTVVTRVEALGPDAARDRSAKPGSYVTLTVSDTGVGMDEATRSRVFEPFFTTKDPGRGTGLGLSMVFSAMKQFGGFVEVTSLPLAGSTFKLWFPAQPDDPEQDALGPNTQAKATILLAEDDPSVLKVANTILSKAGYAVRVAEGAHQALAAWAEQAADLLVSDVRMPEISGADLCRMIEDHTPDLRTVFITGFAPSDADLRIEPGRRVVVAKPFSREQLLAAVQDLLAR